MTEIKYPSIFNHIRNTILPPDRMDSNDSGISDQECYTSTESDSQSSSSTDSEITPTAISSTTSPSRCSQILADTKALTKLFCTIVVLNMCNKKSTTNQPLQDKNRKNVETLNKMTEKILQANQQTFCNMISTLEITSINSARISLKRVFAEVFSDKNCNWGRVVTLIAFAVEVSRFGQKLETEESKQFPEKISEFVAEYLNENISTWIASQGGWDAMGIFFNEETKSEGTFWKGLLFTVFGIGALATTVVACR